MPVLIHSGCRRATPPRRRCQPGGPRPRTSVTDPARATAAARCAARGPSAGECRRTPPTTIDRDDTVHQDVGIRVIEPHDIAVVQQRTKAFVERDDLGELGAVLVGCRQQVPLDSRANRTSPRSPESRDRATDPSCARPATRCGFPSAPEGTATRTHAGSAGDRARRSSRSSTRVRFARRSRSPHDHRPMRMSRTRHRGAPRAAGRTVVHAERLPMHAGSTFDVGATRSRFMSHLT